MKRPIKPYPPVKPTEPTKFYESWKDLVSVPISDGMSLKSILDEIKRAGVYVEDVADQLTVSIDTDYDRYEETVDTSVRLKGLPTLVRDKNNYYKLQLENYKKLEVDYNKRMEEYNQQLEQYTVDFAAYNDYKKHRIPVVGEISSREIRKAKKVLKAAGITSI